MENRSQERDYGINDETYFLEGNGDAVKNINVSESPADNVITAADGSINMRFSLSKRDPWMRLRSSITTDVHAVNN